MNFRYLHASVSVAFYPSGQGTICKFHSGYNEMGAWTFALLVTVGVYTGIKLKSHAVKENSTQIQNYSPFMSSTERQDTSAQILCVTQTWSCVSLSKCVCLFICLFLLYENHIKMILGTVYHVFIYLFIFFKCMLDFYSITHYISQISEMLF